jgi:uncharacterized damage-inducible protein DinB
MSAETTRIKDMLRREYDGEIWHGPSLTEVLDGITASQATKRINDKSKNIAEFVVHITNWRVFTLEKLTGGESFDIILDSTDDWTKINSLTDEAWQEILTNLADTQTELLEILETYSDRKLDNIVSGRKYSIYMLLRGIIQHDIYHAGQMMLVKRLAF